MRRAVDAASEAADHNQPLFAEIMGKSPRETAGGGTGVACADDRDRGTVQQVDVALHDEQRRCILHLRQERLYYLIGKEYVKMRHSAQPSAKLAKLLEEFDSIHQQHQSLHHKL